MDPLSFLKSIMKVDHPAQSETLRLKNGQVINGKIIRFLPNQMAVIQIGSQKLMAKLEASLSVNQLYWFQVHSEAGKIHLKLLKGNIKAEDSSVLNSKELNNVQDGLVEQVFTQVPIQMGEEKIKCSIQWNGRKKADGKIDPENCRIIFFVELKKLGEMIVDLQFQNRRIQMVFINRTSELEQIAQPFFFLLKENLQKLNFQLVSLKFEEPPSNKSLKSFIKKTNNAQSEKKYQGKGVDVRV